MNTQHTQQNSNAQHTPGPWAVNGFAVYAKEEKRSFGGPERIYLCPVSELPDMAIDENEPIYAERIRGQNIRMPSYKEAFANARLIASAPELLAALEQITELAYELAVRAPTLTPKVDRVIRNARTTIRTAKGGAL